VPGLELAPELKPAEFLRVQVESEPERELEPELELEFGLELNSELLRVESKLERDWEA
jgi:hypothetical protein